MMENVKTLIALSGAMHLGRSPNDGCDCVMVAYMVEDPESFEKTVESLDMDEGTDIICRESCEKVLRQISEQITDVFYVRRDRITDTSNVFERKVAYISMLHPLVDTVMLRGRSHGNMVVEVRQEEDIPSYWMYREFTSSRFTDDMVECFILEPDESRFVWIADCYAYALDRMVNHDDDALVGMFKKRPVKCHLYDEKWRY